MTLYCSCVLTNGGNLKSIWENELIETHSEPGHIEAINVRFARVAMDPYLLLKSLINCWNDLRYFILNTVPKLSGSSSLSLYFRADSRFAPSQWVTSLQSNTVSHWLGASLESALYFALSTGRSSPLVALLSRSQYSVPQATNGMSLLILQFQGSVSWGFERLRNILTYHPRVFLSHQNISHWNTQEMTYGCVSARKT